MPSRFLRATGSMLSRWLHHRRGLGLSLSLHPRLSCLFLLLPTSAPSQAKTSPILVELESLAQFD
ncbi:hypothetical protein SAY86_024625 [Trapa natans]|uniref:Uncharacterized protein n=1 Tax=Trapa natans TaxID=22666 RepID=A0AAN7M4P1_TRANT|nr:hypothetical protein SAY86_024625 [Trapa natans]